jgi:hypothetical protein
MIFREFVPSAVKDQLAFLMLGNKGTRGYAAIYDEAKSKFYALDQALTLRIAAGERDGLDDCRADLHAAKLNLELAQAEVDCLNRFATRDEMKEAFDVLGAEFTTDAQWAAFIYAAWAARMDFSKFRDRLKRARDLCGQIKDAANHLATLLDEFDEISDGPDEFKLIPTLLEKTEARELGRHNLHRSALRPIGLGHTKDAPFGLEDFDEGEERSRKTLGVAWAAAPHLPALLRTVASVASDFTPTEHGVIGAALQTRQHSPRTAYIRAFGKILVDGGVVPLNLAVMSGMASVATVAINDEALTVTIHDVRQALATVRG